MLRAGDTRYLHIPIATTEMQLTCRLAKLSRAHLPSVLGSMNALAGAPGSATHTQSQHRLMKTNWEECPVVCVVGGKSNITLSIYTQRNCSTCLFQPVWLNTSLSSSTLFQSCPTITVVAATAGQLLPPLCPVCYVALSHPKKRNVSPTCICPP